MKPRSTDLRFCNSSICDGSSSGSTSARTSSGSSDGPLARFNAPLMRKTAGAPATTTTSDALRFAAVANS